jgi:hypothetical protein
MYVFKTIYAIVLSSVAYNEERYHDMVSYGSGKDSGGHVSGMWHVSLRSIVRKYVCELLWLVVRLRTLDFEVPVFADSYFSCVSCLPSGNAFSPLPPYAADFSYINNKGEMISLERVHCVLVLNFFFAGLVEGVCQLRKMTYFQFHWITGIVKLSRNMGDVIISPTWGERTSNNWCLLIFHFLSSVFRPYSTVLHFFCFHKSIQP